MSLFYDVVESPVSQEPSAWRGAGPAGRAGERGFFLCVEERSDVRYCSFGSPFY
jgi:hypothetical protein